MTEKRHYPGELEWTTVNRKDVLVRVVRDSDPSKYSNCGRDCALSDCLETDTGADLCYQCDCRQKRYHWEVEK